MRSIILQQGSSYTFHQGADLSIPDKLPVGVYNAVYSQMKGFYLQTAPDLQMQAGKLYGNSQAITDRVLYTYEDRKCATGVLLSGIKGAGKSLLAKNIAINAMAKGWPVVLVSEPLNGLGFMEFMSMIPDPCVMLFDEFEKVYEKESQQGLLSLFDGTAANKKLSILTVNDKLAVNRHFVNRPGRIYYVFEFDRLSDDVVEEYLRENLKDISQLQLFMQTLQLIPELSFDIMMAIVQECNRFDINPIAAMKVLNVRPEFFAKDTYEFRFWLLDANGKKLCLLGETDYRLNPFEPFTMHFDGSERYKPDVQHFTYSENEYDEDDEDESSVAVWESSESDQGSSVTVKARALNHRVKVTEANLTQLSKGYIELNVDNKYLVEGTIKPSPKGYDMSRFLGGGF